MLRIFLVLLLLFQLQEKIPNIIDYSTSELVTAFPELKKVEFAKNQDALPDLLKSIGQCVETLFRDLPNTSSIENVRSEALDRRGLVLRTQSQKFMYLLIAQRDDVGETVLSSGNLTINIKEYRSNAKGEDVDILKWTESYLLTRGFASIPVYFHPYYQNETSYRYLGMEPDKTHVIAFAQRPEAARLHGTVTSSIGQPIPFLLQGIAWVDPASLQIVRMRTDLLPGIDTADLRYAITQIKLEEVRFPKMERSLWLPHEVVVTTNWMGGANIRNRHRYSDYRLFTVDAQEDKNRSIIKKP
jgi:hypothetical protein